jgi:hypothetical protein
MNTTFNTLWGKFSYLSMPFGLVNYGSNFKRAMDYAFFDITDVFIVRYIDNLTIFSINDHIKHLKQNFERCKKFGISLNTKRDI